MAKQEVMDLKEKLEKAKKVARAAKAIVNASKQKFYDLEVQETETCLTEKLAEVCKDYCQGVWTETLNLVKVLLPRSGGGPRTSITHQTSERLLQHFWTSKQMRPLQ